MKEKSLLRPRDTGKIYGEIVSGEDAKEFKNFLSFDPEKPLLSEQAIVGFDLEKIQQNPKVEVDAQILEVDRYGRYILPKYNKNQLLERMVTAPVLEGAVPQRPLNLMEAYKMVGGNLRETFSMSNVWSSRDPFNSFTPLFMGPFYRQQYMYRMLEAKAKAFKAYTTNPIAHRIPAIITQFTLGKGVTAVFKDPEAQKWWDEFATYNKIGTSGGGFTRAGSKLRVWSNMLSVDGEAMFQFIDAGDMLKVKSLDTATILEIVSDPADLEHVFYYHQQFATPYNIYTAANVPGTRYIIRQIPANDILHIKLNVFDNEKRGRSDLYTVIGWLKRLKDLINANVIKAYFQACYSWDYSIKGSPTEVKKFQQKNRNKVPVPGSSYYHNENIIRSMISPTGRGGAGVDTDMQGLLNKIALGVGISPTYLLGSFGASRGAVLTETEPSSKFFFERQGIWDEILHDFSKRLFIWLREKKGVEIKDTSVEFSFPQINPIDKVSLINLLTQAKQNKWFTDKRCATLFAKELAVTSYDYDEEKQEIVTESKEEMDRDLEEKKYRSLAQTKLQVWQALFARKGAEEEHKYVGGNAGSAQAEPSTDAGNAQASGGAEAQANSGGMSDKDVASISQGGY